MSTQAGFVPTAALPSQDPGTAASALTAANEAPSAAGAQQGSSEYVAASSSPGDSLAPLPPGEVYLDGGVYEGAGKEL